MKYIGVTIGPIYKTLKHAKKSRELWAGSYLFSYIMKKIIQEFSNREFIIPYVDESDYSFKKIVSDSGNEVGLFHDRMIFKTGSTDDFERLQKYIYNDLLDKIGADIFSWLMEKKIKGMNKETTIEYLKKYIRIYFCEIEFENEKEVNKLNKEMNTYLDILELQENFIPEEMTNYVANFLYHVNKSFLFKDAFGKNKNRFASIPEIATRELKLELKLEKNLYDKIFGFDQIFSFISLPESDFASEEKSIGRFHCKQIFFFHIKLL